MTMLLAAAHEVRSWHEAAVCRGATSGRVLKLLRTLGASWPDRRRPISAIGSQFCCGAPYRIPYNDVVGCEPPDLGQHMLRRKFITLLSGAAAWPLAARAQQSAMPVVGYLNLGLAGARRDDVVAFQRGLNELGFVEGRNVLIEYRWANDQYERLPDLAADLIQRRVTVIVAPNGTATTLAAKALTTIIPIVFSTSRDPVRTGLVASLNQPGGNVTGVIDMGSDLEAKQLELLRDLLPRAVRFAVLVNPKSPLAEPTIKDVQIAASAIGKEIEILTASVSSEIDLAFERLSQNRADALLIGPDALFLTRRVQIATMAARHAVPTVFYTREYVEAGGTR